ncbi:MAG: helix-turn-helix transcriptional regulator [Granulicella sp.]
MKLKIDKEWLGRKLERADDAEAAAGGTTLEELKKSVERRVVTPSVLASAKSELGKVVRFVREKRGLSRHELAELATLSESEIEAIETRSNYEPSLRAIVYLADPLGLSRDRLKELAGFVADSHLEAKGTTQYQFAANSKSVDTVSDEEYEAVRALVEVLSEKK